MFMYAFYPLLYPQNKNRQLFVRLDAKKLMNAYTERLNYFKSTILPFILKKDQTGILLYVEEYYDYINIRNLMMDEVLEEDVAVINEYYFSSSLDCQDICPPMSA